MSKVDLEAEDFSGGLGSYTLTLGGCNSNLRALLDCTKSVETHV